MVYPKGSGEWDEGKALAQDLIRHGVANLTIAKILDVSQSCVSQWRYLAKRNGWQEGVIETYEDPEELGRKLKELEKYRGIYSPEYMQELTKQRMQKAEELFKQGKTIQQVCKALHVSTDTAVRYRKELGITATVQKKKLPNKEAWVPEWSKEWDRARLQMLGVEG